MRTRDITALTMYMIVSIQSSVMAGDSDKVKKNSDIYSNESAFFRTLQKKLQDRSLDNAQKNQPQLLNTSDVKDLDPKSTIHSGTSVGFVVGVVASAAVIAYIAFNARYCWDMLWGKSPENK